jgi:magnesium transporter
MAVNPEPQVFLFLSELLGRRIRDTGGASVGRVMDVVANLAEAYPPITEIVVAGRPRGEPRCFPWAKIEEREGILVLPCGHDESRTLALQGDELLLKESLLDKQIVDTDGAKVRRVNDLQFLKINGGLYLVHVDVGFRGLMRRVGLMAVMDFFLKAFFDYALGDHFISWKYVQPISSPDLLRLTIAQGRLAQIHPADLADIIEELDIHKRTAVFQSLDVETAAETLEETDPKIQVSLIEDMDLAEASDIIEEMNLSEAADLLADLPKEKADSILSEMEQEIAEDVKELLAHPEETAGGLMTSSFVSFTPGTTAARAFEYIRREGQDVDAFYYLYVVDEEEQLLGVLSLRDLLTAGPETRLEELMDTRVVSVTLDAEKDEIADYFAKYGIMALPVVDKENRMEGVIVFKNLLEIVAPQLGK